MSGEKCGYSRLSLKFFLGEIGFTQYKLPPHLPPLFHIVRKRDDGQFLGGGHLASSPAELKKITQKPLTDHPDFLTVFSES